VAALAGRYWREPEQRRRVEQGGARVRASRPGQSVTVYLPTKAKTRTVKAPSAARAQRHRARGAQARRGEHRAAEAVSRPASRARAADGGPGRLSGGRSARGRWCPGPRTPARCRPARRAPAGSTATPRAFSAWPARAPWPRPRR
jgi:hypothetical protein